ncbi:MAG: hypothetical protein J0H68_05135 [Sphingobacteriia bacterium]|nr:hypothetical protein [Sphingobacteriia bacterium]
MVKACSRPINGKNSGEFVQVLPGFYAGIGFGGKRITDAPAFALNYIIHKLVENLPNFNVGKYINKYYK